MASTKKELRQQYLKKRDALSPAIRRRDSALIRRRLLRSRAWEAATTIACYVSFGSEVETHQLIQEALGFKKRIVVPWINPDNQEMCFSELRKLGDLAPGFYKNIFEPGPSFRKLVDPAEIELALVPGVVFDKEGGRIGMGGGYFDRLLIRMTQASRIGLAYAMQISARPLPIEPHDVRVHTMMTQNELIRAQ